MKILVVGTLAYDSVETPAGKRASQLGGSASFFSVAASRFAEVSIVSIVGEDFAAEDRDLLLNHGIDISGVETAPGNTFRWSGSYMNDINSAETMNTQLNVFAGFAPQLSAAHAAYPYLFLANSDPDLQSKVLQSMSSRPRLVAGDTMNHWIVQKRDAVSDIFAQLDIAIINEGEAEQYSGQHGLAPSSEALLGAGLSKAVIKRGEYGAALLGDDMRFVAPAYPLARVVDPTGAGDAFAGGFIGYLAASDNLRPETMRRAVMAGSAIASITVEGFGLSTLVELETNALQQRYDELHELIRIRGNGSEEPLPFREL